jgi:isopentenyldiphosphate isomerase
VPAFDSQELLDVVDTNDRVIEVRPRGEVHRLGLMHRSVHILVFNSAGDFFIQKRSMSKDSNPGLWDSSAAGHVDSGEDYLGCATRELGEELGIYQASSLEPLFRLSATQTTGMEHCTVYHCLYDGPMTLQEEEIEEGAWISQHEMDRRVSAQDPTLTSILKLIWNQFRRR